MPSQVVIDNTLDQLYKIAGKEGKLTGFCIGNTKKNNPAGYFFTPIRHTSDIICASVIVYSDAEAIKIAKHIDGRVDFVFVDSEKKASNPNLEEKQLSNIERAVRENVKKSRVLTYKGNDITVNAIECLINATTFSHPRGISGKKVAIIGCGNIGSKLALRLVEQGANVFVSRRDNKKLQLIVSALNAIKPTNTSSVIIAAKDNLSATENADLVIGLTNDSPSITRDMVNHMAPNSTLIDAGKGTCDLLAIKLAQKRKLHIFRTDIRSAFEGHISMLMHMDSLLKKSYGRKIINGVPMVSAGLIGFYNEVVVDNCHSPKFAYGIADGRGDFIRKLDDDQKNRIVTIKNYIEDLEK